MNSKWRVTYPATLYLQLSIVVVILSWVLEIYGTEAVIPSTGEVVKVQSPFSSEGIRWFLRNAVSNFTGFSPLGAVVVFMFGLGLALRSGFVESCVRSCMPHSGRHATRVTAVIVLLGLLSNVIGDAGYVVLLPLAASTFRIAGLNPLAGLMTAHIAASCGFSANMMLSTTDALLARITNEAIPVSESSIGTMSLYMFMAVSTIVLLFVIRYATTLAPLSLAPMSAGDATVRRKPLSHREVRALTISLSVALLYTILVMVTTFTSFSILRDAGGGLLRSPFIVGILYIVALGFGLTGLTYGFVCGRFRTDRDVVGGVLHFATPLCHYLVIAFFASQMFALISYSNIDRVLVVRSAEAFSTLHLSPTAMLPGLIVYTAAINIIMASASAKWSIMVYSLLPSLAAAGIGTEEALCAFRIGDSVTNSVTPLMPYIPMLLALMLHYEPQATYVTMLRYVWRAVLLVFIAWTTLFFLWIVTGLPLGI
jgi:aminobenzoyl-glutamate transport protein